MGILICVLLLAFAVILSFLLGKLPSFKIIEVAEMFALLLVTCIIANYFQPKNYRTIEENYERRIKILKFLEIEDTNAIIWQPIDNFCRLIILSAEPFSIFVLILIIMIPVFGIVTGQSPISIVFIIIMILALFSGFSRLMILCAPTTNVTLKEPLSTTELTLLSNKLHDIFFLPSFEEGYFRILTNKGYITINKNEVISIHDNEVVIFKEKQKLSPMSIWLKRIFRFAISSLLSWIVFWIGFVLLILIVAFINPFNLQQISQKSLNLLLFVIISLSCLLAFCTIGWYCEKCDEWLEMMVNKHIIVPTQLENEYM
jgi:hypothetical protein